MKLWLASTYIGTKAVATGWGTLKEDGKPSCILQEVEVPIMANSVCVESTNYTQKMITENMLCAGYPGVGKKDSCQVSDDTSSNNEFVEFLVTWSYLFYWHLLQRKYLLVFWFRETQVVHLSLNAKINCMNLSASFHGVMHYYFQWWNQLEHKPNILFHIFSSNFFISHSFFCIAF